jgi:N4-acetylcytidine amidohydrolase
MTPELRKEKQDRFTAAVAKLKELKAAEPSAEQVAHERAAAMHLTTTFGIARPLSDRYVAQAVLAMKAGTESQFTDEILTRITNLDDKFGAALMVVPEHIVQILKGGKHMSRRFRKWGDEGDVFHVRGKAFRFFRVARMRVGDITDDDIRKEGYATREEFEQMWVKAHPKAVAAGKTLQADELCWSHEYEPV